LKPDNGWRRRFDDPIPLPRGRQLVTLQDAGTYITKLRKAEHTAPEWQAAMEALILIATLGGPTMLARIESSILAANSRIGDGGIDKLPSARRRDGVHALRAEVSCAISSK
jgi:hypothetical protein